MKPHLRILNLERTRDALKKAITPDFYIIQTVHTIDVLEETVNKYSTLLRERYSIYAPRTTRNGTPEQLLTAVHHQSTDDLGIPPAALDYAPIRTLADTIITLTPLQETQTRYLETLMRTHAPHLQTTAGTLLGARLITLAGSLKHLAEIPSSTIQVLGAEKALFRHLKTGAKAPRFGILFAHETIGRAPNNERGKIARKLANAIAIATKQDYFQP